MSAIAQAEGTPAYVYSAALLRQRYRELDEAFGDYPHAIHYAFKANSIRALVSELRAIGSSVDAVSIWEVELARSVGFEAGQIVFDGVGKSDAELDAAVAMGLKAINVESTGELARVEAIATRTGRVARVAIRINPDIDAKSHPHISTGLKINKFGIPADEARALLTTLPSRRALKLVALHVHVGSQITSLEPLRGAAARLAEFVHDARQAGIALEYVDAGGGLGICTTADPCPRFTTTHPHWSASCERRTCRSSSNPGDRSSVLPRSFWRASSTSNRGRPRASSPSSTPACPSC